MSFSRYQSDSPIRGGKIRQTARAVSAIRREMRKGNIPYTTKVLSQGQRLDQIAGSVYGDGRLWWVIAAASNIGWALQCPAGTVIRIPRHLSDIRALD